MLPPVYTRPLGASDVDVQGSWPLGVPRGMRLPGAATGEGCTSYPASPAILEDSSVSSIHCCGCFVDLSMADLFMIMGIICGRMDLAHNTAFRSVLRFGVSINLTRHRVVATFGADMNIS